MKKFIVTMFATAAVALSASLVGAVPAMNTLNVTTSTDPKPVSAKLRHKHYHCHFTVTLGHVKKRCHKHRHNKVVHHGYRYH